MDARTTWSAALLVGALVALGGCRTTQDERFHDAQAHYEGVITRIEYPEAGLEHHPGVAETAAPYTVGRGGEVVYCPMTLEQAVQIALANSRVMRDIGGTIVSSPSTAVTVLDPAVRDTDPRGGVEAALSQFDAQFNTSIFWGNVDRYYNNLLVGFGQRGYMANYANFAAEINKIAPTGTSFALRNFTDFNRDNAFLNQFPQSYSTVFEGEVRHPLLQGSGIEFNRIAGPLATPGVYNGVLLARVNTDVTLADFETAVRDLLYNVERTYWELYVAYRDLDSRKAGREAALTTWRQVERKFAAGMADREQEARAREQYYAFDAQVINSLSGMMPGGAPTGAAAAAGAAPNGGGVYAVERRLRWLLGMPANDGRLLRPAEEPSTVPVVFNWDESLQQSLWRRSELRRQKWVIKRRELELIAAKNFLRMRLDLVGQYRFRGTGENLLGDGPPHTSAFQDLATGDWQEWQAGVQLSTPIGNRIGHTAVQNAEYLLSRERAIYREQELRVTVELSDAVAEKDRAYASARALLNGRLAAHQQLEEIRRKYDAGVSPLEFLMEAQRRAVEADSAFYRAIVDYSVSVATIHRARGSLLDYHNVYLNEGPSSAEAHLSAEKQSRRFKPRLLNYVFEVPPVFASPVAQRVASRAAVPTAAGGEPTEAPPKDLPTPKPEIPEPPQGDGKKGQPGGPEEPPNAWLKPADVSRAYFDRGPSDRELQPMMPSVVQPEVQPQPLPLLQSVAPLEMQPAQPVMQPFTQSAVPTEVQPAVQPGLQPVVPPAVLPDVQSNIGPMDLPPLVEPSAPVQ